MENAILLNRWSHIHTPNMNLALMGYPVDDPRRPETGDPISTTRITKVIRTAETVLVKTRNTWYKLGTIDPQYLAYRVLQGLGDKDPIEAMIEWAQDPACEAEFENCAI